jgi:hypothetical protein
MISLALSGIPSWVKMRPHFMAAPTTIITTATTQPGTFSIGQVKRRIVIEPSANTAEEWSTNQE